MSTTPDLVERAREALRLVYDPELGLDVVALGLVYDIRAEDDKVVIDITLTTPGCPIADSLPEQAKAVVTQSLGDAAPGGVEMNVVWDPPWTPERMEEEAAATLGFRR